MLSNEQINQIANSVSEKVASLFEGKEDHSFEYLVKISSYVAALAIAEYDHLREKTVS